MIPSLTELIELFTPKRESYEDIVRSQKNEELKRYCHNKELGFYPVELTKLPRFYQHINKFIEGRATRDLPDEQFDGLREYNGFRSLIEVGGIIGYNRREGLSELSYSVSELDQVEWIVPLPTDPTKFIDEKTWIKLYGGKPKERIIRSSNRKWLWKDQFKDHEILIDWHSHPIGYGEFSEGDLHAFEKMLKFLGNKEIYFVLFQPHQNKSYWYQMKKLEY